MACQCLEGKIDKEKGVFVDNGLYVHDCEYISKRNALIPKAERLADSLAGRRGLTTTDHTQWSLQFHRAMGELAKETGVVK